MIRNFFSLNKKCKDVRIDKKERDKKSINLTHSQKIASLIALGKKRNCISERKKIFTEEILHFILCKRGGHKTPNDVMGCKKKFAFEYSGKEASFVPKY